MSRLLNLKTMPWSTSTKAEIDRMIPLMQYQLSNTSITESPLRNLVTISRIKGYRFPTV